MLFLKKSLQYVTTTITHNLILEIPSSNIFYLESFCNNLSAFEAYFAFMYTMSSLHRRYEYICLPSDDGNPPYSMKVNPGTHGIYPKNISINHSNPKSSLSWSTAFLNASAFTDKSLLGACFWRKVFLSLVKNFSYFVGVFLKNENQILVKKVVNDCNILSSTKARRFYTKYFRNSKNLIRNYCLLTANSKSIIGKFRLSRQNFH